MAAVCRSIALCLPWAVSTQKFYSSVRPIVVYLLLSVTAHSASTSSMCAAPVSSLGSSHVLSLHVHVFLSCFSCSPLVLRREIFHLLAVSLFCPFVLLCFFTWGLPISIAPIRQVLVFLYSVLQWAFAFLSFTHGYWAFSFLSITCLNWT